MRARTLALLLLPALLACGAKTGLGSSGHTDAGGADACAASGEPWLAFDFSPSSGNAAIFVMRADGSERHPLALPGKSNFYPAFSPDGATLLYATLDAQFAGSVVAYDFAKGTVRTVVPKISGRAAWSHDGTKIVYGTGMDLRLVNADGSNDRLLLAGPYPGPTPTGFGHPTFGATSDTVFFDRGGGIESIDVDGKNRRALLVEDGDGIVFPAPALAPSGLALAAVVDCGGTITLRVFSLSTLHGACDGGMPVVSGLSRSDANHPAWSEKDVVAYTEDRDVFAVSIAASPLPPVNLTADLTAQGGAASNPAWSSRCVPPP